MPGKLHRESPALTRAYAWFSALQSGDAELLDELLAHGVPIDVPHPLRHTTALMEATRLGRATLVHWLLAHGAAPAFLCGLPLGTPLHCAIRRHHWAIAEQLARRMGSVAVLDGYGRTPLHTLCMEAADPAMRVDMQALALLLVEKNCPLETLDHEGTTALHHCVINDTLGLAELLLAHGANANALIPDSRVSPLTIASLERSLPMAQLLLRYGADPYLPTRDGLTPITILPELKRLAPTTVADTAVSENAHEARRARMH
ncbi:MAG: ankyrin repeat domain-containing protein [Rickettsiales bacterium]